MDPVSSDDLRALLEEGNAPCVSLFMPTHAAGSATRQDPIRYKNLLREAEARLVSGGMRGPQAKKLLAPAGKLADDALFWQQQSDGLAVFVDRGGMRGYRVPLRFRERVVAAGRFHVKPLLPLFTDDGIFYLLAISQNVVRLLQGTRYEVKELDLEGVPRSLQEALQYDDPERQLHFHTGTPGAQGARGAVFYGHGGPADEAKTNLLRFFHLVDAGIRPLLREDRAPLVLACVDYLRPIYREANTYPGLLDEGVPGNPDAAAVRDLHRLCWAVVEPRFSQPRRDALAQYRALAGTGRTSADPAEIVRAAHHGRVSVLFVPIGVERWGVYKPETEELEQREEPEPGTEGLYNLAAVRTLATGAAVYALAPDEMPDRAPVAAVFRF